MYKILFTKQAVKDLPNLAAAGLDKKVKALLELLKEDPFQSPPPYEKLVGNMLGLYSRRINFKHRLVYQVYEAEKAIKIISLWSHYETFLN